jgi:hypothetical protein
LSEAINQAIHRKAADPLNVIAKHCASKAGSPTARDVELSAVLGACDITHARDPSAAVEWSVGTWMEGLGLCNKLAAALLRTVHELKPGADELSFVRALGRLGSRAVVVRMLNASIDSIVEDLATSITDGAKALVSAGAATGAELHGKFSSDGNSFTMSYGGLE